MEMDLLPLIPENLTNHEVAPSIRAQLQTELNANTYPKDIAENYIQNFRIHEAKHLVENAKSVIDIYLKADADIYKTHMASVDIMIQQAKYLIDRDKINASDTLKEMIKLKRCDLFKKLEVDFVKEYNLIQSSDLLPDLVKRYLDYRDKYDVLCTTCNNRKTKAKEGKKSKRFNYNLQEQTFILDKKYPKCFEITPSKVVFHNYEVNRIYQKKLKITNKTSNLQAFGLASFPKLSCFDVIFDGNNRKLASGMSVYVTVIFKPKIYRPLEDNFVIKNELGNYVEIQIYCTRDAPELISCIFKSKTNLVEHSKLYSRFKEKRREALNSTIDCGSCLVSQYLLISIILENKGISSKFFFITEESWMSKKINDISSCMELCKSEFWIYPTYFKIKQGEIVEINIIFQPTKPGLHLETLYLMCDNNTFQQIELVGDAIEFSKGLVEIKVPPADNEVLYYEGFIVFLDHVNNGTQNNFTIELRNNSPLSLNCEWKFRNNTSENINDIEQNWITQKNGCTALTPYATTAFEFCICPDAKVTGYHSIFFCLYILDIPLTSLKENEDFIVIERDTRDDICGKVIEAKEVDILCAEMEVCMFIELEKNLTNIDSGLPCVPPDSPTIVTSNMAFSCPFLTFGILPVGLPVEKIVYIKNNSDRRLPWKILEVKYNIDASPYMELIKDKENLSCSNGLCNSGESKKLFYRINEPNPLSFVSILVLISLDTTFNAKIEDICIVTYEVINFNIKIKTKNATSPILCPLEIVYKGIPIELKFSVENLSPLIGFFQFLSPIGRDIDDMVVKLKPSSSVINPYKTVDITAKLLCTKTGLLEDFYIPCFIGMGQKPLMMKVVCMVEGPMFSFYLPLSNNNFKQVFWPNTTRGADYCSCKDYLIGAEDFPELKTETNLNPSIINTQTINSVIKPTFSEVPLSMHYENDDMNSSYKYETTRASTSSLNLCYEETKLESILRKEFEGKFLHDDVIEVRNVPAFTPTNVSIFIKNVTPISVSCNVEANNFPINKNFDCVAIRLWLKKNDEIWKDLMGTEYGIIVQPEIDQNEIKTYSITKLDLWIYANTFGIYAEEIVIEIAEIPSYYFSVLIEVVGCPIQIPFALNSVTKKPTIRFGTIAVNLPEAKRQIKITNGSSIPVHISWQCCLHDEQCFNRTAIYSSSSQPKKEEFNKGIENEIISEDNFGKTYILSLQLEEEYSSEQFEKEIMVDTYFDEVSKQFLEITSRETHLEPFSSTFIDILIRPQSFDNYNENIDVNYALFGYIQLDRNYMKKPNYFLRKLYPDINPIQLEIFTRLEIPSMIIDLRGKHDLTFEVNVNDILFGISSDSKEYAVVINTSAVTFETELTLEYPFYFRMSKNGPVQTKRVFLKPHGVVELTIHCLLDPKDLLCLSSLLYKDESYSTIIQDYSPKVINFSDNNNIIDTDEKIIFITKKISAYQVNNNYLEWPIKLGLYYPNISVKPSTIEFGTVLINQTYKDMITVFNHTGSIIKFEICKSSNANCFVVNPHHGEIPASTGINKQSVNIFIYFSANECRKYSESIRVITNIPNYYTEIYLKGTGSINERFLTNYRV